MIKSTYLADGPHGEPVWREASDAVVNELTIVDETDSVTFHLTSETQGLRTPTAKTAVEVRITYADLLRLHERAGAILAKHKTELDAELAAS